VLATVAIALPLGLAHHRRLGTEEAMLVRELGEPSRRYQERTHRLVPTLY
jgi:protein-S-isoprenylcysteine O-methyltransferase Ste14